MSKCPAVAVVVLLLAAMACNQSGDTAQRSSKIDPGSQPTATQQQAPAPSPTLSPKPTHPPTQPPAPTETPRPLTATSAAGSILYTVQAGDYLSVIAQSYGVTVDQILAVNDIPDPSLIEVGQEIVIPAAGQVAPVEAAAPAATDTPLPPTNTPIPTVVEEPTPDTSQGRVVEVVDGDTIKVEMAGQVYEVRYIGVDCPEMAYGDPGAEAATDINSSLVAGQVVRLEKDVSETDVYDRLLRYVWVGEVMVNAELVAQGYAWSIAYPPDTRYQAEFDRLQQEAQAAGRGLWAATPTPMIVLPTAQRVQEPVAGNCSPCYPDVCIPPPPPDLDCGEISQRRFSVVGCDPHRFDGDDDGIGCEK